LIDLVGPRSSRPIPLARTFSAATATMPAAAPLPALGEAAAAIPAEPNDAGNLTFPATAEVVIAASETPTPSSGAQQVLPKRAVSANPLNSATVRYSMRKGYIRLRWQPSDDKRAKESYAVGYTMLWRLYMVDR
jgi:hypothetical protein